MGGSNSQHNVSPHGHTAGSGWRGVPCPCPAHGCGRSPCAPGDIKGLFIIIKIIQDVYQ